MLPIASMLAVCLSLSGLVEARSWNLATDDTCVVVSASNHGLVIKRVGHPGDEANWISREMAVPMIGKVWVGTREVPTRWAFREATEDPHSGTLALVFSNDDPKLTLQSIWRKAGTWADRALDGDPESFRSASDRFAPG